MLVPSKILIRPLREFLTRTFPNGPSTSSLHLSVSKESGRRLSSMDSTQRKLIVSTFSHSLVKIIAENSQLSKRTSSNSGTHLHRIGVSENGLFKDIIGGSYFVPQKIFQMKYRTPRSNTTSDNFMSQKTTQNYVALLTLNSYRISAANEDFDFFINPKQSSGKLHHQMSLMDSGKSGTRGSNSSRKFTFNFTPSQRGSSKMKSIEFKTSNKKKKKIIGLENIKILNKNLLASLHSIIKISPNRFKSRLCRMATKILDKYGWSFDLWSSLFTLFYEVLWEYYSPELNKMSLEEVPSRLGAQNKSSIYSRNDLMEFLLKYIIDQIKCADYEDAKRCIQLIFSMNFLKEKLVASTISINPTMAKITEKM